LGFEIENGKFLIENWNKKWSLCFGSCLIISHKPLNGNKIHKPALAALCY